MLVHWKCSLAKGTGAKSGSKALKLKEVSLNLTAR